MSKRAEEAALKAVPVEDNRSIFGFSLESAYTIQRREGFQHGYEQAEKDTIDRAVKWLDSHAASYTGLSHEFRKYMEEK